MVNRRGVGALGCMVYLVLIAAVVYFGGPFVGAYIDYYRYKDAMKQEAKYSQQHTDVEIQSRLKVFADSLGLPAGASAVRVNRGRQRVTIIGTYVETVPVPILGPRRVRFNPRAEASF